MSEPRTSQVPKPVSDLMRTLAPGHAAEVELARRELADLIYQLATSTEEIGKLRSQLVNDVLTSGLSILDSNGLVTFEFRVPMGSVAIANHSSWDLVIHAGGAGASAPGAGRGVHKVPAGIQRTINLTGHVLTIYGQPGATVSVEIFTGTQPPSSGPVSPFLVDTPLRPGTPLDVNATGAAGAATTATLPAAAGRTTWLTGFELTWDGTGAVAATSDVLTVTAGATVLTYRFQTAVGVAGYLPPVEFPQPIPASAPNTAITLAVPATANRAGVSIVAHGFQL
jgi:hypothetical protein